MPYDHRLAGDAWVATSNGPRFVRQLTSGAAVRVVRPDGRPDLSAVVASIPDDETTYCSSLLTIAGEILVPPNCRVVTKAGVTDASAITAALSRAQSVRLEIVSAESAFPAVATDASYRRGVQAAAARLPGGRALLPGWIADDTDLLDRLRTLLDAARIDYSERQSDYWNWFTFEGLACPSSADGDWISPKAQAEATLLMTAWAVKGEGPVGRLPTRDLVRIQHLVACSACAHMPYRVRWVPGYFPVEVRLEPADEHFRSHVPVSRCLRRHQRVHTVALDRPGFVIAGLAMLS